MKIKINIAIPADDNWKEFFQAAVAKLAPGIEMKFAGKSSENGQLWTCETGDPYQLYQLGIVATQTILALNEMEKEVAYEH